MTSKSQEKARSVKNKPAIARRRQIALMAALGQPQVRIAEALGLDSATVCRALKEPDTAALVERLQEQSVEATKEKLSALHDLAVEKLEEVLREGAHNDVVKAVTIVLDRTGVEKGQKVNHHNLENLPLSALRAQLQEGLEAIERLEDEDT